MQKEYDQKQRFSLRKLSVGLASVLVGVGFMAINAGQTVHADELQTQNQPDSVVQKADNDSVNDNKQNQTQSNTSHAINHIDPNSKLQQNVDKNATGTSATTATNAIVKQKDNAVPEGNENTEIAAKDDSNKVQANVDAPQKVAIDQKSQTTVAFAVKRANKAITANMLNENKIADVQGNGESINKGVDPVKFASNGGFDPAIWGTMDTSKWQLDASGNITGYTGDMAHIIIPNSADFAKAGKTYRQISISSDKMRQLGSENNSKANTLAISLTNDKKVKATNANWSRVFTRSTLEQANLEGLDTSSVTNMQWMFDNAHSLTSLDVSKWDTGKVTDMSGMFNEASSLTSLDVSEWNTSGVTDMHEMFSSASGLTSLDVSTWATSKVTNMESMFGSASGLKSLDVSKWDTSNVTNMEYMFIYASGLTNLDVSNWNTSNVTNMSAMFDYARGLTSLDVSNWDTSKVTNMSFMFKEASGLTSLDVSKWDTGKVTDMSGMFNGTSGLTSLDVSNWKTSNVNNMSNMFSYTSSLTSLDVSKWDTSNVTNMAYMFNYARGLTSLNVSNWDTSKVTNMSWMFNGASSLTSLDVSNWDTSKVADMSIMFNYARGLKSLDVSKWKTGNVTNMNGMFGAASSLKSLDVSNWDTSKVTNMGGMFSGANSLKSLDVSKWNTSKVTDMRFMFDSARSLTSLNVSNWDTSKVTDMRYMFSDASSLTNLDVSKWNTSNVTIMRHMFKDADKLTLIVNNRSGWQHATDDSTFDGVPVVITNNINILNATDNGNYTIDGIPNTRSVIFDSTESPVNDQAMPQYKAGMTPNEQNRYASDVVRLYNKKLIQDYENIHLVRKIKYRYSLDEYTDNPVDLARAEFVTVVKIEPIPDNQANYNKLHATATREYIIHNIDGSTTTITQSINYHRTGEHNLVTNDDIFTEWIYSPDENSMVVVATKDKTGKAIASPVTVEGDNCIERDGKAYFGSLKIKPKAGFKLSLDKPATTKLNLQAKLTSKLLPRQFFVLKVFAPMPHEMTKQIASANSIKPKQNHNNTSAKPITSANAIKQGKNVIVKPVVKPIEPNKQTAIHEQTHADSPINGLANSEAQLVDVQNISMANNKQAKPDPNNQASMQVTKLSTNNRQKSAQAKSQHPVTQTNNKVKATEITAKSADSRQNQNKKVLAEKASAKPVATISAKAEKASAKPVANIPMTNISIKAKKTSVKPAVNIPAKTVQPATQKIAAIAKKQNSANPSLPQTSSANDLGMAALGLIMSSLGITLAGVKNKKRE